MLDGEQVTGHGAMGADTSTAIDIAQPYGGYEGVAVIFGRKTPAPIARLGGKPIDFALLGSWVVPFADRLVVAPAEAMPDEDGGASAPGSRSPTGGSISEVRRGAGARTITFAFVDEARPVDDHLCRRGEAKISWVIRERLDRSIFCRSMLSCHRVLVHVG